MRTPNGVETLCREDFFRSLIGDDGLFLHLGSKVSAPDARFVPSEGFPVVSFSTNTPSVDGVSDSYHYYVDLDGHTATLPSGVEVLGVRSVDIDMRETDC